MQRRQVMTTSTTCATFLTELFQDYIFFWIVYDFCSAFSKSSVDAFLFLNSFLQIVYTTFN